MSPREKAIKNFKEAEQKAISKYGQVPKHIIIAALKSAHALTIKEMREVLAEYDNI